MKRFETPILFIIFNRPSTTKLAFERIKKLKPSKLYVSADGPRNNHPSDEEKCAATREIVQSIDWDCDIRYNFYTENQGCKLAVTGGISWVFEHEDRVIVIEDDVVAEESYFHFADILLEKYKDDPSIGMISANNYTADNRFKGDYLFTRYGHIWGWATWKRVWDKFDVNVPTLEDSLKNGHIAEKFTYHKERKYHVTYFNIWLDKIKSGTENAWGPQFYHYRVVNDLLSIVPAQNLASNVGVEGTHTNNKFDVHYFPVDSEYELRKHPDEVKANDEYNKYHFDSFIYRRESLKSKIKRTLNFIKGDK